MTLLSKWLPRLAVAFLALAALPATVCAQIYNVTGVMPVRTELVTACTVSADNLDFGAYASNSPTPVQGQTTIHLLCGAGSTAELLLDAGSGPGGGSGNTERRRMEQDAGKGTLGYDLFQDAGRTVHWGDRSGRDTLEVQTTGSQHTITIYGQIPAGQRAVDGTYSDTITLTILY